MPLYEYKAKKPSGEIIFGSEKANDEEELAKNLLKKNIALISTGGDEKKAKKKGSITILKKKIKLTDKMMFTRHLAVMINAGFPFDKSLDVLANQTENEELRKVLTQIKEDVVRGSQFSAALKKHPKVFDELYVNMTKIGEETGGLKDVLNVLANQMKKDHDVRGKVKGALMYPAILITLMAIVGVTMMIFVLPKFSSVFEEMQIETPVITQVVLGMGDFLAANWYILPIGALILFFAFSRIRKTKKGKRAFDSISLKAPMVGSIMKKLNTARTSRILSSLIKSGVPIVKSLDILSRTLTNHLYKDAIKKASKEIQRGKSLKECLEGNKDIYSYLLIQVVEVGEETGNLGEVLEDLAEFYEGEVDTVTKNLSSIIEPVLMSIIGIAVAVFAISIVQPMYSMMGQI